MSVACSEMNDLNELDGWFTLPQVGQRFSVSRQRAAQLFREGRFPNAKRIGDIVVVPKTDVETLELTRRASDGQEGNRKRAATLRKAPGITDRDLADYFLEHWDSTILGQDLELLEEAERNNGSIDILARRRSNGRSVVLSICQGDADEKTFFDLAQRMGSVRQQSPEAKSAEVEGIIVAEGFTEPIRMAGLSNPAVSLLEYSVRIAVDVRDAVGAAETIVEQSQ